VKCRSAPPGAAWASNQYRALQQFFKWLPGRVALGTPREVARSIMAVWIERD
jgi:hypothetical protein